MMGRWLSSKNRLSQDDDRTPGASFLHWQDFVFCINQKVCRANSRLNYSDWVFLAIFLACDACDAYWLMPVPRVIVLCWGSPSVKGLSAHGLPHCHHIHTPPSTWNSWRPNMLTAPVFSCEPGLFFVFFCAWSFQFFPCFWWFLIVKHEARQYWLHFTEYIRAPAVKHFASLPDLLLQAGWLGPTSWHILTIFGGTYPHTWQLSRVISNYPLVN